MHRFAALLVLAPLWALGPIRDAAGQPPTGLPEPMRSTVPAFIDVVGRGADGQPDSLRGTFEVVVRDAASIPVANAMVVVDFGACPDIRIDRTQWPSLTVDCGTRTVRRLSDAAGVARFCIVGSGTNTGGAPGAGLQGAIVYAMGIGLAHSTAAVTDQNGAVTTPGVELSDVTSWIRDWGSGTYYGRSDYDHDGTLSLPDLLILLRTWGAGSSIAGPVDICP